MITPSPVLPIAHIALRIAIVLNLLWAVAIAILMLAMPYREWIISALDLSQSLDADRVIAAMRRIVFLGVFAIGLNHLVLTRLLAIVRTVRAGDPFVADNAARLRAIAWTLLILQLVGMGIEAIAKSISTPANPVNIETGFSITGWLAVVLMFVLARVFTVGAAMRSDLEGTI
jgi:hypothetical protein